MIGGDGRVVYRNLQSWVTSEVDQAVQQALDDLAATDAPAPVANAWNLRSPVPNPFNPRTEIVVEAGNTVPASVSLTVFDARGRRVRALLEGIGVSAPGITITWDGLDERGAPVPSGVYHFRLIAPGGASFTRGVLVR